tara:strand:+ start:676 stop:1176 length:501 start_codon:yes stop_codon:yes gene_type:complete
MKNLKCNGRVNIIEPDMNVKFSMMDKNRVNDNYSFNDALTGVWYDTKLSDVFFSSQNMQLLQNEMKVGVYNLSNKQYIIGPQDSDNLKIIMRNIFIDKSKNQPDNITEQIRELNQYVLDYAVPQIYNELVGYYKYKRDISTIPNPPPLPMLSKSSKQLDMKEKIFF